MEISGLSNRGQNFQCKVLPFCFSLAPRVFPNITKPLAARLLLERADILMYLNDWLVMDDSQTSTAEMVQATIDTSTNWGFRIDLAKSHPVPSHTLQWLGFTWDT